MSDRNHAGDAGKPEAESAKRPLVQGPCPNLPLVGTMFEATDGDSVLVIAGRPAAGHITHPIQMPRRIWLERSEAGADAALGIESANGTMTIVDGIARIAEDSPTSNGNPGA